jgi:hypothetical protein
VLLSQYSISGALYACCTELSRQQLVLTVTSLACMLSISSQLTHKLRFTLTTYTAVLLLLTVRSATCRHSSPACDRTRRVLPVAEQPAVLLCSDVHCATATVIAAHVFLQSRYCACTASCSRVLRRSSVEHVFREVWRGKRACAF